MKNFFSQNEKHSIVEANINYYSNPFVHPKRTMAEYDFIYLLQGEWKIGQNDEIFDLKKDSLLILSPNNLHYGAAPCAPNTKTVYFHMKCETTEEMPRDICLDSLIDASLNRKIKSCFFEIVDAKLSGNQKKADLYFEILLCELAESYSYSPDFDIATRIKSIIHNNPETFYSNQELAKALNVSVKTAENKFKSAFGITIHQYILKYKIDEAINYFEQYPKISIKEVSYNLGFYDEYHFSKQFKKLMGVSPAIYRKHN